MVSEEFAESAGIHASDFTRQRSLPLPHLISMLLNLRKGSISDELSRFFEVLHDQPLADSVSGSAFCQARKKLNPRALMALNEPLLAGFERHFSPRLWHGLRLLAVDGSTARLPNTADVIAEFGAPPAGASVPLARFSRLYDVLKGGETEVLAPSLLDEAGYPRAWFKHLYHLRWGVEEGYKREKCRLEIENFSGLSAQVVKQDFFAKIFVLSLTAILTWVAQAIADASTKPASTLTG